MTSTKAAAAIVIVAVLVVAVGAYALLNQGGGNGGGDTDAPVATIGTTVEVGDEYTLSSIYSSTGATLGADTTEQTKYTVTGKDGENLTVQVESNGQTSVDSMTQDDFLDDVSVVSESLIGTYDRNETISTNMGTIDCMIYKDQQSVGNTTTVTTYDWIGIGTNIIYKTQIEVSTAASTETYTTTLYSTNMIGQGGSAGAFIPDTPSTSGSIRTDLEVGDYIEFSKRDDDGRDYERITIVDIDGDRVVYREHDDDDREITTVQGFLSLVVFNGDGQRDGSETISTVFGDKSCDIYLVDSWYSNIFDADWEDQVRIWVDSGSDIIYKIEIEEDAYDDDWDDWDDWHDDYESFYLTGTSLMSADSGGSGGDTPSTPGDAPSSDNRYGITLSVGDYYIVEDDNGRDTETREIIAINGNYLTVRETNERGHTEIEHESANEYLSDFVKTSSEIERGWASLNESATVSGHSCQIYQERYDDDRDCIWIEQSGSNYIVWQEGEYWNGQAYDVETIVEISIDSLPSL